MAARPGHAVLVQFHVEGGDQAVRTQAIEPFGKAPGPGDADAADDHAACAMVQAQTEIVESAYAPAGLHGLWRLVQQAQQGSDFCTGPIARSGQVHHVQPAGAFFRVAPGQAHGVQVVYLALVEIAVQQPHATAVQQINRGNDLNRHGRGVSRKRRSRVEPAVADRSGWNCAPQKLFLRTMALNCTPCRLVDNVHGPVGAAYEWTK